MSSSYASKSASPLAAKAGGDVAVQSEESFWVRWLVMPKVLYFMLNLYVYGFHSLLFLLFIKQWKFPYYLYGYATTITSMNFFGAMIWSSWADRTGRYKTIIISTSVLYTIVACLMLLFRAPEGETLTPWKTVLVFVGFGFFNFFLSAAFPLVDALILGMLSTYPKVNKEMFGNQRMFGAVGHFAATLCSLTIYKKDSTLQVFIFQLVVSILFITVVSLGVKDVKPLKGGHGHHGGGHGAADKGKERIASPSPSPLASGQQPHQVPVAQATTMAPTPAPPSAADELAAEGQAGQKHPVLALLTDPNFLFFMLFILCMGVVRSVSSTFQKLIALDLCHGDKLMTALIDFGRMLSEIFVYLTAKYMRNSMGIYWILIFSQVMGIVRIVGYAVVPMGHPWAYILAWVWELIKGFSSGMVSSSAIPIASRISPPGCESSAQGLFSGNYSGLSMAFGGAIGGGILHWYYYEGVSDEVQSEHAQNMLLFVSAGTALVTLVMALKYIFVDRVMGLPGFPRRTSV